MNGVPSMNMHKLESLCYKEMLQLTDFLSAL